MKVTRVASCTNLNYAMNINNWKSILGALHTIASTLVSWASKTHHTVLLSRAEVEYISAALAAYKRKVPNMLLDKIYNVEKSGILLEDTPGCIFQIQNATVGMQTKHINV